jgi:glucokinase
MRSINGIGLLNLIGEQGPISRASLAKLSRLSKPTVSSQVETLIRQGLVVELGQGESGSKGGKKPTLLRFNAEAGLLFAVEIDSEQVRLAVSDLEGKILEQAAHPIGADRGAGAVLNIVCDELDAVMGRRLQSGIQRVVTIAAPGRVDVRQGVVLEAGNVFNWRNVPVRATLESRFGVPVFVENNVNMATLGEVHHGVAKNEKDVVLVRLDTGIGSGIVVRGKLVYGAHWAAGEIAHVILDLARASEDWSARGYLESVVGADLIFSRARAFGSATASAAGFLREGKHFGGPAKQLFDTVIAHLGIAIANLVCAYDPALVVLQGELLGLVADDIRAVVSKAVPWTTRIAVSEIGGEAVLLGTVVAARTQAYDRIARLFDSGQLGVVGSKPVVRAFA